MDFKSALDLMPKRMYKFICGNKNNNNKIESLMGS
jgi:hypothetical protein